MNNLEKNIIAVFEEIEAMSDAELNLQLKKHASGDIAKALLESGALEQDLSWEVSDWITGF